ncbi:TetR/AcrR family transcriptional regulator [Nesterenkonia sp. F]|uniref:TetR/AcrR family transcriptional regulator n=1 Tax=Nesterenkonia sp. F TaxID=795955 RepID=UPI000255C818|nr:WHG domain-containing protein [Nesterenkonia sp. F]
MSTARGPTGTASAPSGSADSSTPTTPTPEQAEEPRLTPRQKSRRDTEAAVLEIANRQLDSEGVPGLSLRAVARELGLVSSAVYRYVRSRDELLTLLIADAYDALADAVEDALVREGDRLDVLAAAMLDWSRRTPRRWELIHGTPLTDYRAPREHTLLPGTRVAVHVVRLVDALPDDDAPFTVEEAADHPAAPRLVEGLQELGVAVSPSSALRAVTVWTGLLGMVHTLRSGLLGPGYDEVEHELMAAHVRRLIS